MTCRKSLQSFSPPWWVTSGAWGQQVKLWLLDWQAGAGCQELMCSLLGHWCYNWLTPLSGPCEGSLPPHPRIKSHCWQIDPAPGDIVCAELLSCCVIKNLHLTWSDCICVRVSTCTCAHTCIQHWWLKWRLKRLCDVNVTAPQIDYKIHRLRRQMWKNEERRVNVFVASVHTSKWSSTVKWFKCPSIFVFLVFQTPVIESEMLTTPSPPSFSLHY